ncbi:ATP-dependent DNA helicase RecQ [Gracilimonas sp. Q87]|uniref:RecQ family ATP-dependent DNA helicase n=1 Tax=Gracilimonas sp. Q87 TaxID=3384766 RepID=UPI003983FAC1
MENLFTKTEHSLKRYWGFESFREGQDEVVRSVIEGADTLVLFPTGGGKSLCYQAPATVFTGMTLVISPLVALMQDQVQQLKEKGITATFINSTIPSFEVEQRLVNARNGMYKLLYCAPERLKTELWQAELPKLNIDLIAIDEAHCISEWGHDFRPSYREIRASLESIAETCRWIALTATATPEVQKDIVDSLGFKDPKIVSRGFSRPNLKWWITHAPKKKQVLKQTVQKAAQKGDGLIYGGTRRNCEELARQFSGIGIKTEAYHAGIDPGKRKVIQQKWITGEIPLVVATNAFGMGIDKPNCRYVIHEEMPYSLEAYYQEAGRAGRDGKESFPILLYRDSDHAKAVDRIEQRYPKYDELDHVYQILCDTLNLAVGSVMEESEILEIKSISQRGKISYGKLRSALRLMAQFDVIGMQEEMKPALELQFGFSSDGLKDYKNRAENDAKAEFVDKLERLFGPESFRDAVFLDEDLILDKLNIRHNALIKGLDVLSRNDKILSYRYYNERTRVKLLEARSRKIPVSKKDVESYRNNILRKLEHIHGYVVTSQCREVYLRSYFGDLNAEPCGHCDNCLKSGDPKHLMPTDEEFQNIQKLLNNDIKNVSELAAETGYKRPKVDKILRYLIKEEKATTVSSKPGYYKVT